jgi:hypothetical protein
MQLAPLQDGKNVTFFDAMTFTPVKKWVMVGLCNCLTPPHPV